MCARLGDMTFFFQKHRNETSVVDDICGDAELVNDDRKHTVVRTIADITGETQQCRLKYLAFTTRVFAVIPGMFRVASLKYTY